MTDNPFGSSDDSDDDITNTTTRNAFGDESDSGDENDNKPSRSRLRQGARYSDSDDDDDNGAATSRLRRMKRGGGGQNRRRSNPPSPKKRSGADEDKSSAYDVEVDIKETKEDRDFIVSDDDDDDLMREYNKKQDFTEDGRDDTFEAKARGSPPSARKRGGGGGRGGRKRGVDFNDEQKRNKTMEVLTKMENASTEDTKAIQRNDGTPATEKIKILKWTITQLKKKSFQETYLGFNLCGVIEKWLRPLPDGSLCMKSIRDALYEVIEDLPIESNHLESCGLAKVLIKIMKSDSETSANKNRLRRIVEKWMRNITNRTEEYGEQNKAKYGIDERSTEERKRAMKRKAKRKKASLGGVAARSGPTYAPGWIPQLTVEETSKRRVKRLKPNNIPSLAIHESKAHKELKKSLTEMKRKARLKSSIVPARKMSTNGRGM